MDETTTTTFDPDLLEEAKRQIEAERNETVQDNGSEPKLTVIFKPSEDRLNFHVRVGDWRKAQKSNIDAIVKVLAAFMVDDSSHYLAQDVAIEILDELTFGELVDALERVTDALEESAVPKK